LFLFVLLFKDGAKIEIEVTALLKK